MWYYDFHYGRVKNPKIPKITLPRNNIYCIGIKYYAYKLTLFKI